ncbi:general substrate transporter [Dipodascopsis tothii]|uniref:general substrate transporter n=1 Tax=Dipodascopsis tothii TaxID=44089 RepID=UPI0034CD29DB
MAKIEPQAAEHAGEKPDAEAGPVADADAYDFDGLTVLDVTPVYDRHWWHVPHLRKLNLLLMGAMLTQVTSGFDGSMLNGLQSLPTWRDFFGHPQGQRLGVMSNGITWGVLASMPFVSPSCEKFGRRKPMIAGSLLIIIGAILQGAAQNYAMFVAARFILGVGLGTVQTAAPLLLAECAYPSQRGKVTSFIEPAWPVGSFLAAVIIYGTFKIPNTTWSWRIPSLLQGLVPIVQCVIMWFAPESPRWLISKDRHEEALQFFVKYHGGGDQSSRLVRFEMAEVSATLEAEKAMQQSRWAQFFETRGMRHRFFICVFVPMMLQLSGNALMSYYLSIILDNVGITDSNTQLIINMCSTIWGIITAYAFASQVERIGRRPGFFFGLVFMLLCYILWTILSAINQERDFKNHGLAAGTIVMMYLYSGFYHLTSPFGPTYVVEVVPFSLRSKATMMYQLCGNIAGVFNNFVNPIAMKAITWKYYIVYCCVLAVEIVVVYFTFPETGGKGLEEIAEIFDGPDALVGTHAMEQFKEELQIIEKAEAVHEDHVERRSE